MSVSQFTIFLICKEKVENPSDEGFRGQKLIEVDLTTDDVGKFLDSIPDDIDEHSTVWVTIRRPDGKTLAYIDGCSQDENGKLRPLHELSDDDYKSTHRQAIRFAEGKFRRRGTETNESC